MVATALSMVLIYVVMAVLFLVSSGQKEAFAAFETPSADVGDYLMQAVMQGLQFGIAVAVILFGVRTILGELVPAFQGIAERVVPGAVPALDCPIVFPFAQNAVLVGFLSSFVGGLVSLGLIAWIFEPGLGMALILPGLVPHFFTGGTAGVFGNATGGRRGAVAGAFVNGVIITFLPALLLDVLGSFGKANTTFGDADFGWFGIITGYAVKGGPILGLLLLLVVVVALIALAIWVQKRFVLTGWDPGAKRDATLAAAKEARPAKGTGAAS
jgi:PTS system ascorbate-specific IIC component